MEYKKEAKMKGWEIIKNVIKALQKTIRNMFKSLKKTKIENK